MRKGFGQSLRIGVESPGSNACWRSKKIMYAKYVNLQTNVQRIRDQIDGTSTLVEIAGQMSIANKVLEEALKNEDYENAAKLRDELNNRN